MDENHRTGEVNIPIIYGEKYQREQADKYRTRSKNHWKNRIELAFRLFNEYVLPEFSSRKSRDIKIMDIGCSVGTFAIEFAKSGYASMGVDSDATALKIAKQLCKEENADAKFIHMDIAKWDYRSVQPADVAVCFDIFEHLQDDELGRFLYHVERMLPEKGMLVFHTYPTAYYFIFQTRWKGIPLHYPLRMFKKMSSGLFERIVKTYSHIIDIMLILRYGSTLREKIEKLPHNNLLSKKRLVNLLDRAGFDVAYIGSGNLYPADADVKRAFEEHEIAHMNLFGVARKRNALSQ